MKALVCTQYGPPEVLQLKEVEKPPLIEVTIGGWLLLRGIKERPRDEHAPASSLSTIPTEGMV